MAESNPTHDHVEFLAASMVAARTCTGCGAYVSGENAGRHQEFHDRVRALESMVMPVVSEGGEQLEMFADE